jgi:hypothetical protein
VVCGDDARCNSATELCSIVAEWHRLVAFRDMRHAPVSGGFCGIRRIAATSYAERTTQAQSSAQGDNVALYPRKLRMRYIC